jgi:hypothetical protein
MIILFWIGFAVVVGVGANTRGRNGPGWGLLAVLISPLLAGLLLLALPRGEKRDPTVKHVSNWEHWKELRLTTDNKSFYTGVSVWVVLLLIVGIGIIGKPVTSPPAPKASTTQSLTPNVNDPKWVKDFTRRVIEACDHLPVGHRDRPHEVICGAPR